MASGNHTQQTAGRNPSRSRLVLRVRQRAGLRRVQAPEGREMLIGCGCQCLDQVSESIVASEPSVDTP
ncbi:MAG: hypothetical protein ACK6EB_25385, partial [Planctomyces sp.]